MYTEQGKVTIVTRVKAGMAHVWNCWTTPRHVMQWNTALDTWHSPRAANDLRPGGRFNYRMEAKDGSMGFDFEGTYTEVIPEKYLAYTLDDERKVTVAFNPDGDGVRITETFETENENPVEMQRSGWQSILDNFRKYAEETGIEK